MAAPAVASHTGREDEGAGVTAPAPLDPRQAGGLQDHRILFVGCGPWRAFLSHPWPLVVWFPRTAHEPSDVTVLIGPVEFVWRSRR
jgi:hypothetical protein